MVQVPVQEAGSTLLWPWDVKKNPLGTQRSLSPDNFNNWKILLQSVVLEDEPWRSFRAGPGLGLAPTIASQGEPGESGFICLEEKPE